MFLIWSLALKGCRIMKQGAFFQKIWRPLAVKLRISNL